MIALLGAVWNEVSDLVGDTFFEKSVSWHGLRLWQGEYAGQKVLLVQTGMGKERAESAAGFILKNYPVQTALSFGFGGALAPHLTIADLIFCQSLHDASAAHPGPAYDSDRDLIALAARVAERQGLHAEIGDGLTVDHLVCLPEEKQALEQKFSAQVVDMESYWVARCMAERCRFLALRSISDTSIESLPPFDRFVGSQGEWLWKEMAAYLLARPQRLAGIPPIFFHTRQARKSLTHFLRAFLLACGELGLDA